MGITAAYSYDEPSVSRFKALFCQTAELASCRASGLRERATGSLLLSHPDAEESLAFAFLWPKNCEENPKDYPLPDGSILLQSPVFADGQIYADAFCVLPAAAHGEKERASRVVSVMAKQAELFLGQGGFSHRTVPDKAFLKAVLENPSIGFAELDTNGKFSFCSSSFTKMLGKYPEDLTGKEYNTLLHPEDREDISSFLDKSKEKVYRSEKRFLHKERIFWGALSASRLPGDNEPSRILLVLADITEQKRTENMLNIQHELSNFLSSTSHLGSASEKILDSCLQIEGIDCGSLYTIDVCSGDLELVSHREISQVCATYRLELISARSPFAKMLSPRIPIYAPRNKIAGEKEGEPLCREEAILGMAVLPILCEGELVAVLHFGSTTCKDIPADARLTLEAIASKIGGIFARIRVESAFRESEQRLRGIMDNSSAFIFIKDINGTFLVVSRSFAAFTGKEVSEIEGKQDHEIFPEDFAARCRTQDNEVLTSRVAHEYEVCISGTDGLHTFILTKFPLYDDSGKVYAVGGIAADISERKKFEEVLQREQRLFTEGPVVVFKWAAEEGWPVEYVSPNFSQFGHDAGDFMKGRKPYASLVHPEDLPRVGEEVREFIESGVDRFEQDYRIICANGELRWIYDSTVVVRNGDGELTHFYGYVLDISERKQVEESLWESEERFRTIADFTYDWEYWLSPNGDFIYVSPAVERITGYTADEFMEDPDLLKRIIAGEPPEPLLRCLSASVCTQGVHSEQIEIITKDGQRRWIGHVCQPVYNHEGHLLGRRGSNRDITDERHAVDALKKAKVDAEATARLKSQFLANMSHEIRTPMNAIIGFTDLTLETSLSEQQLSYLKIVKSRSKDLLDLINDILDLSRIEAGKLKISPVRIKLQEVLHNLIGSFKPETESKKLALSLVISSDVPDIIIVDPLRIRQILTNLIGNAIKFTQQGEICVSVRLAREEDMFHSFPDSSFCEYMPSKNSALLKFSVRDTGIGIAGVKQTQIFEAFTQADGSIAREYGGTGLGLAICSRLVELMGGRIWVESNPGKGSIFNFTSAVIIPDRKDSSILSNVHEMEDLPEESLPTDSRDIKPMRILVTEDDPSNQLLMKSVLEGQGHSVFIASSGQESLSALKREQFDIILMDVQMPEMDGIELTKKIRASSMDFKNIPIVAVTAFAMERDRERCLAAGMNEYLSKPIYEEVLKGVLAKFCP